jgi:hypothetical protein
MSRKNLLILLGVLVVLGFWIKRETNLKPGPGLVFKETTLLYNPTLDVPFKSYKRPYKIGEKINKARLDEITKGVEADLLLVKDGKSPQHAMIFSDNKMYSLLKVSGRSYKKNNETYIDLETIDFDDFVPPPQKFNGIKKEL